MDPSDIIAIINKIFLFIIPVLMMLGTVIFIYGVVGYLLAAGDEEKRKEFKNYIVWSVVALFAMVAVWGIVRVLVWTFGLSGGGFWGTGTPPYPPNSPAYPSNFFYLLRTANFFIISPLINLMFVIGTAVFLWGVVEFIWGNGAGDEEKIKAGKKYLIWGIIALFVMVAVWAIVTVLQNTFGWGGLPYIDPIYP